MVTCLNEYIWFICLMSYGDTLGLATDLFPFYVCVNIDEIPVFKN